MSQRAYPLRFLGVFVVAGVVGLIGFLLVAPAQLRSCAAGTAVAAPSVRTPVRSAGPPGLNDDMSAELAPTVADPAVEAWKREVMRELAEGRGPTGPVLREEPAGSPSPSSGEYPDGYWLELLGRPETRSGHTVIYDPVREEIVVFGGFDGTSYRNDTWLKVFPDSAWKRPPTNGELPPGRANHTAIYDPVGQRMIVFGGTNGPAGLLQDAWAQSLGDHRHYWTRLPDAPMSTGRYGHTAIYDPIRQRMWVFGGDDGLFRNDVWALDLGPTCTWSQVDPTGVPPSARRSHTAVYDAFRKRMVVFGGNGGARLNDTWELTLEDSISWVQRTPEGEAPSPRYLHTAVYDTLGKQMIVFGGNDGAPRMDVWALSLDDPIAWTTINAPGTLPQRRAEHTAVYDPVRMQMVVFGGVDVAARLNDLWVLPLAGDPAWSELGSRPPERGRHTAVYDPVGNRMIVFGGSSPDNSAYFDDVWALSLAGRPNWTKILPSGSPPPRRKNHSAIYDPRGQRMIVFGGYDGTALRNDTWALSLTDSMVWSLLVTSGSPPAALHGHSAICDYDPNLDEYRMVVFGGESPPPDGFRSDVWELSLGDTPTWTQRFPPGGRPIGRYYHAAAYVPARRQMIVFGGWGTDEHGGSLVFNDVWELGLADPLQWSECLPSGTPPSPRGGATAAYDPAEDRMVVHGGYPFASVDDTWWLWLDGVARWERRQPPEWETPPPWLYYHAAVLPPIPPSGRFVVFGGFGSIPLGNDTWSLSFYPPSDVSPGAPAVPVSQSLLPPVPNPFCASTTVQFDLPSGGRARLDLLDVTGRQIRILEEDLLSPGTHRTTWNGTGENGRLLPAGVYFLRLKTPGGTFTRKVVRIQ